MILEDREEVDQQVDGVKIEDRLTYKSCILEWILYIRGVDDNCRLAILIHNYTLIYSCN